jgi:exoribonuclease II
MRMAQTSYAAVGLLMDIGYFPIHVNLDVLKLNIQTEHNYKSLFAAEQVLACTDPDEVFTNLEISGILAIHHVEFSFILFFVLIFFSFQHIRTDLTSLKVYAIDVDEADEVMYMMREGWVHPWVQNLIVHVQAEPSINMII